MAAVDVWRKIAAASWGRPVDPQIYGEIEVDAERLLAFIETERARTGAHVTVTHVVGRAVARALAENPEANIRLRRGRFIRRDTVDVFFAVAVAGGRGLSGVKVERADRKSAAEIATELERRATAARRGEEPGLGSAKRILGVIPSWALGGLLRFATWLVYDRGISLARLGLPEDAFGSAIISSVSGFGAERVFGPMSPWYRVPLLVLVSEVRMKPVVVSGEVVARPRLMLGATLDHRYLDGALAGRLVTTAAAYLEDPEAAEAPGQIQLDVPITT